MLSPADVEPSAAQPPPNNLVARPKRASGVVGVPRSPVRRSRSPPQFIGSSSAGSSAAGAASYSSPPQFIGSSSAGASAAGAASNSSPPQFIGSRSTAAAGPRSSAEAAGGTTYAEWKRIALARTAMLSSCTSSMDRLGTCTAGRAGSRRIPLRAT